MRTKDGDDRFAVVVVRRYISGVDFVSLMDSIQSARALIREPRYDHFKVCSLEMFTTVPRVENPSPLASVLGFPVVVDEKVEPGWVEMWKGDELIERTWVGGGTTRSPSTDGASRS